MKKRVWIAGGSVLLCIIAVALFLAACEGQENTATVIEVVNRVDAHPRPEDDWQPAVPEMVVYGGGQVRTGTDSSARLELLEGMVRLSADSVFTVKESVTRQGRLLTTLFLQEGRLWANLTTDQPHKFTVETGNAVAAVRDTHFSVQATEGQTLVSVVEGEVELTAQGQSVTVGAGQQAIAERGQPPTPPEPMSDEERALWDTEVPTPTQTPTPTPVQGITYGLVEIIPAKGIEVGDRGVQEQGAWQDVVFPETEVQPSARGGAILVEVRFGACTEEYRYSWEFDRDISQLRPGDRFIVSARNELMTESCDDSLDASSLFIRGNAGTVPSPLIQDRLTPETEHHFWGNTEGLYGKRGPKEKSVEMGIDQDAKGPFQWFEVNIYPGHGGGAVRYQIVYWYEAG